MRDRRLRVFVVAGLAVAVVLAAVLSQFASSAPDGLERVATDQGFADSAEDHALGDAPLADYGVRGVEDDRVGTAVAGLAGVALTFAIGYGLFAVLRRREDSQRR